VTTCIGGTVSFPTVSGEELGYGLYCKDYEYDCRPTVTTTNGGQSYDAIILWEPAPPSVFSSPGTYVFTAKLSGITSCDECTPSTVICDWTIPPVTIGTFTVFVKPFECHTPFRLSGQVYECAHFEVPGNCESSTVIRNVIDTMSCQHDTDGCGSSCFLQDDPNGAFMVTQDLISHSCEGGSTTNSEFVAWTVWGVGGCGSCQPLEIKAYCQTGPNSDPGFLPSHKPWIKKVLCP
jgi:hypothetical protein